MQSRMFNNPALAQGLSGLVESFIGNPAKTAAAEEAASRALLNNQTAQYREAIGETGLSGDLASMMIRALQAGPGYSGNAPRIGNAAIQMGAAGFGSPELTPSGPIAALMQRAMVGGGGRSSGGGGSSSPSVRSLTQSELARVARLVRDSGYEGADAARIQSAIVDAFSGGGYSTLDQVAGEILPDVRMEDVQVGEEVTNPAGTMLSRLFGLVDENAPPDEVAPIYEKQAVIPDIGAPQPTPQDTVSILNQAREAIASGADPVAVAERLKGLGIDPTQL